MNQDIEIKGRQRPCFVTEERKTRNVQHKALFHCWYEMNDIIPPSPMIGGMPGGTIKRIYAIVEFEDGSIHECMPEHITFVDGRVKEVFDAIKEDDVK